MSSSPLDKSLQIDFNDRIESLHTSVNTQLTSLPQTYPSLQRILHFIPTIFRVLRQTLQQQQKLLDEYNELTDTSQKVISLCTQYTHDRHAHENQLLLLKDKISHTLGQIGYTQHRLEEYWTMIRSLEEEIERLQSLLSNAQLLQSHRLKFQTSHDTQKIKLNRLLKENEHIKMLTKNRIEAIEKVQAQIELDVKELRAAQAVLHKNKLEQEDVQTCWLHIDKQTSHLRRVAEHTQGMENEYLDRTKTTTIQYDLVQKQLNSLNSQYDQSSQKLADMQSSGASIKQEIENVKKAIDKEQADALIYRDQVQELRHQTTKHTIDGRHIHRRLKADEHTNSLLERKGLLMKYHRSKLHERLMNLTGQLAGVVQRNVEHEHLIQENLDRFENQQYQMTRMQTALKKVILLNNNLEKELQENRFLRSTGQEKLRSIKQLSFQRRKQLIVHTKRLHELSTGKQRLTSTTLRNSLEITRLSTLSDGYIRIETYLQRHVRQKKSELMSREKQRASLSRYLHDNDNRIHFLTKKNQLIENELQSKVDQRQSLQHQQHTQKHNRIIVSNRKQLCIYSCQQRAEQLDELHKKYDRLEKLSDNELSHFAKAVQENERLKVAIDRKKQQIVSMVTRNQRQVDECSLLKEKIRLCTHLDDMISEQEQRCAYRVNRFCQRAGDLQRENNRLLCHLQNSRTSFLVSITSHHSKLLKERNLHHSNQIASHPLTRNENSSSKCVDSEKTLEDYVTSVNQLMKIIHQIVHWRERLAQINQLYFAKMGQIHEQIRRLIESDEMLLRARNNAELKHCKAARAECYLRALTSSAANNSALF